MVKTKDEFIAKLQEFAETLTDYVSYNSGDWRIKGFIDIENNVYSLSSDTKIISKILEIQLFPKFKEFADSIGYKIVLAEHQNWYPDLSFVNIEDESIKFAVDIKTTYRIKRKGYCNKFTLGSHGKYFRDRASTKNVQYPYGDYTAHLCLGIIYTRAKVEDIDETEIVKVDALDTILSVIKDLIFFVQEKWKIASDKSGSGNTANIGSINHIDSLIEGNGTFINLGEKWFDEYWIDYDKIDKKDEHGKPIKTAKGKIKKITDLKSYLEYRGEPTDKINNLKIKSKQ